MYQASKKFGDAIAGSNRKFNTRLLENEKVLVESVKNFTITSGAEEITIGSAVASYVQATIENKGIALSGKEVSLEIGVEVDGEMEYIPMGLYTIQNPKIESNKVTFTAYDRLASRCNGAYYSKLSYPTDAVDILAEISTMTGVAIDTSTLQRGIQINQRAIIEEGDYNEETEESEVITTYVNPFDGYTYKETIGFIAGLFGKFAICGRTGMIEFRWYQGISYEIPSNIFYNDLQETEESFSIKRLICDNSDQTLSSGSGVTGISMQNPVMTQSILDSVYNAVKGLIFTPAALRFIGDTRLDIGDIVTAVKNDCTKFTIPIISLITSYDGGLMQTIASYGNTAEEDDSDTKGPITEMAERVEYELAFVKKLMVDNLTATNATIKNLSGDVLKFKTGEFETLKTDVANFKQTFTDDLQASNAKINTLESDHATFKEATATNFNATNARIANIEADYLKATDAKLTYATITNLNTTNAEITKLKTKDAEIDKLVATKATITDLNAAVGRVGVLESSYANLNTLVNGNLTSDNIQNLTLTSKNTTIENGMIKNAMIENLSFDKITGMDINTTNLTVHSSDGKSKWSDNTIQISDANRVRVQIGKDASNDYSMSVWDKNGNLIWDAIGATEKTIQRKIIRDGIVADDANISGSKLDINSVVKEVNGSTTKLKSSTIVMNDKNQTLDAVFNEMETTVADNLSSAKLYADGKLSDAQKYALEQANSALSSAKSYADSAVDNIEVGGRNLVLDSINFRYDSNFAGNARFSSIIVEDSSALSGHHTEMTCTVSGTGGAYGYPLQNDTFDSIGKTITISFYWKCNTERKLSIGIENGGTFNETVSTDWKKITKTYVPYRNYYAMVWYARESQWNVGDVLYIRDLKIEFGNKATDWTPAPEDTQSQIDNITEITTSHTTSISTMQGQISSLISEDTTIKGNYNALLSRYNATVNTVDSMKTTIGEHTTILNSQNDSIAAVTTKANTIESNLAGTTQTVSEVKSNLVGTQERVTKVETSLTGLTTRVSSTETNLANLEIGGRNLLWNSGTATAIHDSGEWNAHGCTATTETRNNCLVSRVNSEWNGYQFNLKKIIERYNLVNGDILTYSIDVKMDEPIRILFVNNYYADNKNCGGGISTVYYWDEKYFTIGKWERLSFTFKITQDILDKIATDTYKQGVRTAFESMKATSVGKYVYFACPKLERGTKATDYTPAPEDVNQQITAAETIASQTADKFEWIVKGGDSSSNFTLTDRVADLVAERINFKGLITFSGLNTDAKNEIGKVAQSKVDGLEVGGRNLLKHSSMIGEKLVCDNYVICNNCDTKEHTNEGFHIITPTEGNANNGIAFSFDNFTILGINGGDTITFSCDIKGTSDSHAPFISIHISDNNWYGSDVIQKNTSVSISSSWQRVSVTITTPTGLSKNHMWLAIHGNYQSDLYVRNFKLEKGNKATDWMPAPEDVSQDASNKANQALTDAKNYSSNAVNWVTNNGSSTTSLNSMVKKWTDGAVSDTAQINGGWIKANTITASKIAIGDFTNYCDDPYFENGMYTGGGTFTLSTEQKYYGTRSMKMCAGTNAYDSTRISQDFELQAGEKIYVEYYVYRNDANHNAGVGIYSGTSDYGAVVYDIKGQVLASSNITNKTWTKVSYIATANRTGMWAACFKHGSDTALSGDWYLDNVTITRMTTGELIVDGSITADKIATDAIKSRNYISSGGTQGSFLNLSDGSFQSPNLSWDSNGNLIAKNANLSGQITATKGSIGKYEITDQWLITGSGSTATGIGGNQAFWAGAEDSNSAPFRVGYDGKFVSSNADISGKITATEGKIGKYEITDTYLKTGSGSTCSGIGSDDCAFWAGGTNSKDSNFVVLYGGSVLVNNLECNDRNSNDALAITNGTLYIQSDNNSAFLSSTGFEFEWGGDYRILSVGDGVKCYRNLYATDFIADGWIYNAPEGHYTWKDRNDAYISCGNYNNTNNVYYYAGYHAFYVNGDSGSGMMYIDTSGVSSRKGFRNSSDERIKKDFRHFDDDFINSYMQLEPIKYRFKDDTDNSYHIGFKAQNVNSVLNDYGKSHNEQFGICATHHIDPEYAEKTYGENNMTEVYTLAYDELIGANTFMIQKTRKDLMYQAGRIDMQEAIINDLQTRLLQAEKTIKQLTQALA